MKTIINLERKLQYQFKNPELLTKALTHKSYVVNNDNNERLEFLGDSLLNIIITLEIFALYPLADEGKLTRIRAKLVCEEQLAQLALELELEQHILLGRGEKKAGANKRYSILADAFEALLAAIYLDSDKDLSVLTKIVLWLYQDKFNAELTIDTKDAKTLLQEYCQTTDLGLPVYEVIEIKGSQHNPQYQMQVTIMINNALHTFAAIGLGRKKTEQLVAAKALQALQALQHGE